MISTTVMESVYSQTCPFDISPEGHLDALNSLIPRSPIAYSHLQYWNWVRVCKHSELPCLELGLGQHVDQVANLSNNKVH